MIDIYTGTPGSGKSLHSAETIYYALRFGRPVIANFEINTGLIKKMKAPFTFIDTYELNPAGLRQYAVDYWGGRRVKEDSILLVIDEAQLIFNAREWSKQGRSDWLSFFTQHRKMGYHIILVAQFDMMIDKQIRSLIEYNHIHRKVSNFGKGGKVLSLLGGGRLFIDVKVWYPLNEKVESSFFTAKKKYYGLYNTYSTLD